VCRDSPAKDRPPSVSPVPGASLPLGVGPRSAQDRGTLRPCRHTLGKTAYLWNAVEPSLVVSSSHIFLFLFPPAVGESTASPYGVVPLAR